jgi:hypothetical protein
MNGVTSRNSPILRDTIHEAHHARKDLDGQSFDQPWYVFHKYTNEPRGKVFWRQFLLGVLSVGQGGPRRVAYGEVLVHNFTSSKVAVVEMYYTAGFVADGASTLHQEAFFSFPETSLTHLSE